MKVWLVVLPVKCQLVNQNKIKGNYVGGTCGRQRGKKKTSTWFCWKNVEKRDHLENQHTDWTLILKGILKKYYRRAWAWLIWLLRRRKNGRLFVNMIMNLWVPLKAETFSTCWGTMSLPRRVVVHGVTYCFLWHGIFFGGGGRGLSNCLMGNIMMDKQQQENVRWLDDDNLRGGRFLFLLKYHPGGVNISTPCRKVKKVTASHDNVHFNHE